jgi:hypothetical protein
VLYINNLTQGVTGVTGVTAFSEFILGLLLNTVLFSKKNFNLKTPVTPVTPATNRVVPHFCIISTCDTTCDTL